MKSDTKQRRLQELFADLRYLKQKELTHEYNDPVMQANHMIGLREQIARIEERIEEEMNGEGVDQRQGEDAGEE